MEKHILKVFDEHKLVANEEKTEIYAPKETFNILGIKVLDKEFDLAKGPLCKVLYKLKHKQAKLLKKIRTKAFPKEVAYQIALKFVHNLLYGNPRHPNQTNWVSNAFSIITTEETLRYLDKKCTDFLRTIKSGKQGNARFRVTYEELKQDGYIPLVYHFYHREKLNAEMELNMENYRKSLLENK